MHIELVESLRCPVPHEETWLVASVTRFDGRDIVEGVLGCPICRRQYPVRRGEVDFTEASSAPAEPRRQVQGEERGALGDGGGADLSRLEAGAPAHAVPSEDEVLRVRALLALDDGGGIVLLGGTAARFAATLADAAQVAPLLLNAPPSFSTGGGVPSSLRSHGALPVAAGVLRAAWLDAEAATPLVLSGCARALKPGGRLVAPAAAALPDGVRQLAADSELWVAEATGAPSAPVALRRR